MKLHLRHHVDVSLRRDCVVHRRDFLKGIAAASVAAGTLGWRDLVSLEAAELRKRGMACILLWMQGGPSQFETFDPKPGHANGGETKTIPTAVPSIHIADGFPQLAAGMKDLAIIRSMTSKEGSHPRATFLLHTGYLPTASVKYPTFGSVAAHEIASADLELPAFVRIGGGPQNNTNAGLLGVEYDPFVMNNPGAPPANTLLTTGADRYNRRLDLLGRLEAPYAAEARQEVEDHQKLYRKAARMIQSPSMKAFDLGQETAETRAAYSKGQFASGCLLARRLVESGVTFVEVNLGGWDTHFDNFATTKRLAGQVDQPFARLIADLKERGLLDTTLVVWMGEFGRTPRVNPRAGRDHYPRSFSVVLAGGGVRGGQVIGRTDAGGTSVEDRPATVPDLFQSFCKSLKIDPATENFASNGRPIKIVDSGQPVKELFA